MNFDSFKDAPWFGPKFRVIIGGVGNIGSWTSILLARMGYELYLYDMDVVELRNVGSQFYSTQDIGKLKVNAAKDRLINLTGNMSINTRGKYDASGLVDNIMISCFDNMKARKEMFKKWLDYQQSKKVRDPKEVNIFIDGRSLAETGIVYAVTSVPTAKKYEEELFDDHEIEEQECSFKSTSHNGAMISSIITSVLVNHICNKLNGVKLRDVPWKIEYQLPLLSFHTYE